MLISGGCSKPPEQATNPINAQPEQASQPKPTPATPKQSPKVSKSDTSVSNAATPEGDTATYVGAMSSVSNNVADALDALEASIKQYTDDPQIRHDKEYRVQLANNILQVDNSASQIEDLPLPPSSLRHVDSLLRDAAKEMHASCLTYAKALETGSVDYLNKATTHQQKVQSLVVQAGREFHDFKEARQ